MASPASHSLCAHETGRCRLANPLAAPRFPRQTTPIGPRKGGYMGAVSRRCHSARGGETTRYGRRREPGCIGSGIAGWERPGTGAIQKDVRRRCPGAHTSGAALMPRRTHKWGSAWTVKALYKWRSALRSRRYTRRTGHSPGGRHKGTGSADVTRGKKRDGAPRGRDTKYLRVLARGGVLEVADRRHFR